MLPFQVRRNSSRKVQNTAWYGGVRYDPQVLPLLYHSPALCGDRFCSTASFAEANPEKFSSFAKGGGKYTQCQPRRITLIHLHSQVVERQQHLLWINRRQ